ncbi:MULTISPECIES: diaminopimelate decarboxylase [Actinomadura]|uniref:Diaminopimelate decarboxylase n=1 Tax=Actinomadura yumaensis TaxID=111807 RepID=A0ABW2CUE9_9ACTN|nr:diaminopimelate decarboxylase [Actinomadura sp. J1-007]MWK37681.1 diaminopimelate decarboxylase [Actinomadura sp. J1-007]
MAATRERGPAPVLDGARAGRGVWPATAHPHADGDVSVGGVRLTALAERFGTPLHVVDEDDVRRRCRAFRSAFHDGEVAYAGKAFLCRAMARWAAEEGLSLDVCSAGELAVARAAGFPGERTLMHGNAKTPEDLRAALGHGVGRIVVDSFHEITRLAALASEGARPRLMVRVTPGVDGRTHAAVTTGTDGQKFGFSLASGAATEAVRRVLGQRGLALAGLHCHIGSQITDPAAYEEAARRMVGLLAAVRAEHGAAPPQLDLGGGFGVAYRPGDPELDPAAVAERLRRAVRAACAEHRVPVPRLTVEPGRAIVARAGTTVYRVVSVKHGVAGGLLVAVDGGMSDNPRPGLYGARYTVRLVGRRGAGGDRAATVVGRHCEAGDVLVRDARLPADVRPGDLLAVPCTGAYHHAMASNYNLVRRPPVVAVRRGRARLLVRRETVHDLLARDVG